jgi:hypothetical protein
VTDETRSDDVADALARIERQVGALNAEVRRLGSVSALPHQDEDRTIPPPAAYNWLGALPVPTRRRPQLPRLLLEGLFLAAVAAAAAIADLDAVAIAGVMLGAWVLVAAIEWTASRADERMQIPAYAPPLAAAQEDDSAWYSPPVEQTLLDGRPGDPVTAVTRLPPAPDDVESTVEQRPA